MKVAIVVGHRKNARGAHSKTLKATEYDFNSKVAEYLKGVADIYFRTDFGYSEASRVKNMCKRINRKKYDLVIELHFNSFHNPQAHGCTALHYITNKRTKQFCIDFCREVRNEFGIKARQVMPIKSKRERGGVFILNCNANAVILEPFFGSNVQDCQKIKGKEDDYANLICRVIEKYCK